MIDQVSHTGITGQLLASLKPVSVFYFNISDKVLDNKLKWRIS